MAKITVNYPNRPKGSLVSINKLGRFENGKEHDVDDAKLKRLFGDREPITVFGKPLGSGGNNNEALPPHPVVTDEEPETTYNVMQDNYEENE